MDRILNKKEIGELLGCDVRTVDRYIQRRLIPFVHVGRHIFFSFNRLCQWMSQSKVEKVVDEDEDEIKAKVKEREREEAEESLRQRIVDSERYSRLRGRAEEELKLLARQMELQGKEEKSEAEEDEESEISEKMEALVKENESDLENEWKEFREFFCDIEEPEAKRIFLLFQSR